MTCLTALANWNRAGLVFCLTPALMQPLGDKLKEDPREIGGRRVERTNRLDGVKFILRAVHGC